MSRSESVQGESPIAVFVRRLPSATRTSFLDLRALALSLGPDVVERVRGATVEYGRRAKPFVRFEDARGRLTAHFPEGLHLPDPSGRLLRRGLEPYVRVERDGDPYVADFVRHAYTASR